MEMEISEEAEDGERRWELWKLLSSLKTTVEGLLSTNNPNVWSRYGGLQRLHKDMNNVLGHGLRHEQTYYKQKDYWRFVWCVRYLCPHLARHVEQFSQLEPVLSSGVQSVGEGYKAERWLLHSLQAHILSAQLKPLLQHRTNTQKYYNDGAFLLSEAHVCAMFQCLEAVEQNNPRLLALIDTGRLSRVKESPFGLLKSQSMCVLPGVTGSWRPADSSQPRRLTTSQICLTESPTTPQSKSSSDDSPFISTQGAPWVCGRRHQDAGVHQISFTEPASPAPPEIRDCVEADVDDGPEYLAIGNLGKHKRRDSSSSTQSSEHMGTQGDAHTPLAPPPQRSCSFSGSRRTTGRSSRGHIRSLSDTGVTQKQKHGGNHRKITIIIEDPVAESVTATPNSKSCGPFSTQSSDSSTNSSVYMESNGRQNNGVPDGLFRRPSEGQSLISYLSEQDFGSCADLEKENAHFSICESLIAAIELMKCNMRRPEEAEDEGDSDTEIQQLKQKIRLRRLQIRHTRMKPPDSSSNQIPSVDSGGSRRSSQDSFHPSDSGSDRDVEDIELKDADIKRSVSSSRSFLSSDSISPSMLQSNSAESVAMGLLRQFEGMQLPAASELDWLVPEHDAPQKLLPIPDSLPISPDDGEHADIYKLRIRVRGNLEWAPPRPQIIFNVHSAPKRKVVVAKQNYRCAGCGIRIDPDYIKRLRYCEYLGRYFCQCCHENAQSVVPGKILRKWDFSKSYVSNFSRDLLAKITGDPLFNLNDINSALYKKVKALETVRALREQLYHMKNLLKTCRLAQEVRDQFDTLPGHLTEDFHLFSLSDLTAVRSGSLAPKLRDLLRLGSRHVTDCVLCQAKGFICEFCGNDKDIFFPYELSKCLRCEDCHACYHKTCFKGGKECPRCLRLAERRKRMACKNMEEQEDREADEASGT
ncbi:run domain Beclin-1-interacting and cysteine-rich domain-containing protein isoform X2 [Carassius gibelio]|uniref:run domain Beclin-1-interacting and cysteine-rich domain-containing protein isoform X2 n=1 Tax=Carassius gibelio TaxID=101364 RepID=UPI00227760B5|nr:run domain Beclin-1-interacting and cysteine-rich domain-containing protein isoform X2 [Carassius gibelio]